MSTAGAMAAPPEERNELHARMHAMMDTVMGSGASERMHTAMPGSEVMMEACAQEIAGMAGDGGMMDGMMGGDMMHGTMDRMMER
jgi:hypothetical protein